MAEMMHTEIVQYLKLGLFVDTALPSPQCEEPIDVSFMHRSFCAAGLPLRRPKNVLDPYARNDGRFSLTISPQRLMLPDGGWCDIGVPWGPKGRLLIVWATSQALDPSRRVGDRWLEIGRIDEWLSEVGIAPNARSRTETKDMIFRLAFSQFTMIMKQSGSTFFKSDRMFERGAFHDNSLTDYASGNLNRIAWPVGLELSQVAYERFTTNSIPIPTARLAKISHNAMAIDVFLYLCYRLPLIGPGDSEMLTWRSMASQFGSIRGASPTRFRDAFGPSLKAALDAYPEANVSITDEGLVMSHSDPADLRRAFIAVSLPKRITGGRRKLRNRFIEETERPMF